MTKPAPTPFPITHPSSRSTSGEGAGLNHKKRLLSGFKKVGECLEWQRGRNKDGYGNIKLGGKPFNTHRAMWLLFRGPIPAGLEVTHRCDNPPCGKLAHLRLQTHAQNLEEAVRKGRKGWNGHGGWPCWVDNKCPRGHEATPENIYIPKDDGRRRCKECRRIAFRKYDKKRRGRLPRVPVPFPNSPGDLGVKGLVLTGPNLKESK